MDKVMEGVPSVTSEIVEEVITVPPIKEEEKQWAKQAQHDFDKGNYDGANGFLAKIATNRSQDPKVIHNKAVVNYFKSGLRRTDEFKMHLLDVCNKMKVSLEKLSSLDDVDQCTAYYNYAVILYRLQQYTQAVAILDRIFQFIEPMDEKLSQKVVFLLIELYLTNMQPEKVMGLLSFVEKNMLGGNGKSTSPDKETGVKETGKDTPETTVQDPLVTRISHYKTRCYLMIMNLKPCKREIKSLSNVMGNSAAIVYLKANYEYLRGNYRKAIKVLNTQPQVQKPTHDTGEHVPTMYYNNLGVIHFCLRKHNLGAFYFRKALHENGQIVNEFHKADLSKSQSGRPLTTLGVNRHFYILYNMGIQLLHCNHPSAAFDCLIETIHMYQINPRLWLRLAECCVMAHKANNDEDRKLSNRLRVIQTSVGSGIHKKLVLGPGLKDDRRSAESAAIPNTTLEFASLCLKNAIYLIDKACELPEGEDAVVVSLENLLVAAPPGNPLRLAEVENLRSRDLCLRPYHVFILTALFWDMWLTCSVLAASAYVCLCLNDHAVALKHSRQLLAQNRLSGAHRYLAHMYMAEALVALDKIADAVQELQPDNLSDVSVMSPAAQSDTSNTGQELQSDSLNDGAQGLSASQDQGALQTWTPKDVVSGRAYMHYNLATAHTIRGEYEKALLYLQMSTQNIGHPLPAQMYSLNIYLELMEGRRKSTQSLIKEHFGHLTSNRPSV